MPKIRFDKDIYKLLGCVTEEGGVLPYPDWDVLKELDRREKRRVRAKGRGKPLRDWMRNHPEEVECVRRNLRVTQRKEVSNVEGR